MKYAPGMRVIIRDEEWMIRKCDSNSFKTYTLQCVGLSPLVRDKTAYFISDLEKIVVIDPSKTTLVPDRSSRFVRSRLFLESQWRQKIPTDAKLHIGHHAVMDVMPYQLEPAAMSLARPRQRILMADGVGLGKTLEAGILISELIARGKGRRILVVTVKSMMAQFQKEMWERFSIPLISLDSAKIQRIRRDLPSNHNPFHYYDKTIVSIDTIKRDSEYRVHLEHARWDIIVIDEAHNVAKRGNSNSQRARLADLLSSRSDTLIMLSATPHDGRARSFASLMNMLDPTAIPDPDNYTEQDIKDNGDPGTYQVTARLRKGILAGAGTAEFVIMEAAETISISDCNITVKDRVYTGKAITPKVTVKYGDKTLKAGRDYTLDYNKKLTDIGPATVTVKGKGDFSGSKKVAFKVIPKGTTFTKLTRRLCHDSCKRLYLMILFAINAIPAGCIDAILPDEGKGEIVR